jgi:hypothetical protein
MAFPLEKQKMSMWCWAAVAVAVDRYFSPNSSWSQCKLAAKVLGKADCCTNPQACNSAAKLQDALRAVGRFKEHHKSAMSFDALRARLDAGFPVGVRIGWGGGGGHFVLVTGYRWIEGEPALEICDPQLLNGLCRYDDFVSAYCAAGKWTHSYLVEE